MRMAALRHYERGRADLSDYLIGLSCHEANAAPVFTFGRRAASDALFSPVP